MKNFFKFLVLLTTLKSLSLEGGVLLAPEISLSTFSFRSSLGESRPNYYALGGGAVTGFSFSQSVDVAAFASFFPAYPGKPAYAAKNALVTRYGGQISFRIEDSILLGIRGGKGSYELRKLSHLANEVSGLWHGYTGSLLFGALLKLNKKNSIQISTELIHMLLIEDSKQENKRLDAMSISISYIYNGFMSQIISNSLFNNFF